MSDGRRWNSRWAGILIALCLVAAAIPQVQVQAQDDEPSGIQKLLTDSPSFQKLSALLKQERDKSLETGNTIESSEAREAAQELISGVEAEWKVALADYKPSSVPAQAFDWVKDWVVEHINPVRLGRWILMTAKLRGPGIAIAMGTSELTEYGLTSFGLTHPHFAFLVPIAMSHGVDAATYAVGSGAPEILRTLKIWNRHGGVLMGALSYYQFLVDQKKILPLDLDRVLAVAEHPENPDLKILVLSQGLFERYAPKQLEFLVNPMGKAQKASSPYVTLDELSQIAKQAGVSVSDLRKIKGQKQVYSQLLFARLLENPKSSSALFTRVQERNSAHPGFWTAAGTKLDVADALKNATASQLMSSGETPDSLARRYVWYFREQRDARVDELEEHINSIHNSVKKPLKVLRGLIDGDSGLSRMANTRFSPPSEADFQSVLDQARQAQMAMDSIDQTLAESVRPISAEECIIESMQP